MSRVVIYFSFKMKGNNKTSPFSEFIEKFIQHVRTYYFYEMNFFLEFSENNGKSGKDYI